MTLSLHLGLVSLWIMNVNMLSVFSVCKTLKPTVLCLVVVCHTNVGLVYRHPYNLYCVDGDVKPCSINQSVTLFMVYDCDHFV